MAVDLTAAGRKGAPKDDKFEDTIARKSAEQGMLLKLDELIDAVKALTAKLDGDTGVADTDYAASISDATEKLKLKP